MLKHSLYQTLLTKLLNVWPPYLGAGIRIHSHASSFQSVDVEMKLRFWNTNFVGTQFGGSLYSMCDPFFMFILMENLGNDYIVWDKAATIRFKKPGKGTVRAHFHIPKEKIEEIRVQLETVWKVEPTFIVEVKNDEGEVIAEVEKLLYVRKKKAEQIAPPSIEKSE
jgi:hypothetical protein